MNEFGPGPNPEETEEIGLPNDVNPPMKAGGYGSRSESTQPGTADNNPEVVIESISHPGGIPEQVTAAETETTDSPAEKGRSWLDKAKIVSADALNAFFGVNRLSQIPGNISKVLGAALVTASSMSPEFFSQLGSNASEGAETQVSAGLFGLGMMAVGVGLNYRNRLGHEKRYGRMPE